MNKYDEGIDMENFSIEGEVEKFKKRKVPLWRLLIRLYINHERTESGLLVPPSAHKDQEYAGCVGLVVGMGPLAYKGEKFQGERGCEIGEWRLFPRHNALKSHYKGMTVFLLDDDQIGYDVDDPRDVKQ